NEGRAACPEITLARASLSKTYAHKRWCVDGPTPRRMLLARCDEKAGQRANHRLTQLVTRPPQSYGGSMPMGSARAATAQRCRATVKFTVLDGRREATPKPLL